MGATVTITGGVSAAVSYKIPTVSVSYRQIGVEAKLTFPDRFLVEVVAPTDVLAKSTTKGATDTFGAIDVPSKSAGKAVADSVTVFDDTDIDFLLGKLLHDAQSIADVKVLALSKALIDTQILSDAAARAFTKKLADITNGFAESLSTEVGKALADSVLMEDDADIDYWIDKHLSDTAVITAPLAISFATAFHDYFTNSDLAAIESIKAAADATDPLIDAISQISTSKGLADSFSTSDSIYAVRLFMREFVEELFATDSYSSSLSKPFGETILAADVEEHSVTKGYLDNVVMIDNMDGDIQYHAVKLIGELISTPTDLTVLSGELAKADAINVSASGVAFMTDYADISYFAEDFVGVSSTFS